MNEPCRLDILVSKIYKIGRTTAQENILAGRVSVNGRTISKPGARFPPDCEINLTGPPPRYVSRGGYKLEKGLKFFGLNLEGLVCLDAGSSTGGFTDCMLQKGANIVYAVDCGTAQLNPRLLEDSRVVSMEKTNIRDINRQLFSHPISFAAADLSFISLTKTIIPISECMAPHSKMLLLVKPQFECGRAALNKRGIVTKPGDHIKCAKEIYNFCAEHSLGVLGFTTSPIKGSDGNREYLILISADENGISQDAFKNLTQQSVDEAFSNKPNNYIRQK